ncbi:MAG: DUF1549 and DUF1553 domain-containing protein [Planctomycetia bacterium]|nr:DUF1549 and DUF1553 domain-containing protein [Planctomycetia bacterium]
MREVIAVSRFAKPFIASSILAIVAGFASPLTTIAAPAAAANGSDAKAIVKIEVFPPDVNLSTKRDSQRYLVMVTRADGVTQDVTNEAKVSIADKTFARVDQQTLYPVADGTTTLDVTYGTQKLQVPVVVKDAAADRPVSFHLDVMPVFMRSGCNTGSCHGAARGKDGFMLSLFGYDPKGDHMRITHELGNRRINLGMPAESLLLEKNDGSVPHTGGKRFDRTSAYYQVILEWLNNGAPLDEGEVVKVVRVDLYPKIAVLEGSGTTQQMIARAVYADGTDRDITNLAVFLTNNDNSAPINENGLVTAANRGEAFVMARFDTHTVGSQLLVLPKDVKYTEPAAKPANYIDDLVGAKLKKLRIIPSELCTDEVFLRRVTLDITGLLPTEEEFAAFSNDKDPSKRTKLVDRLLERKEFAEIWAMKWAEVLKVRTNQNVVSTKAAVAYADWLTAQISDNVPLDKMVRDLLSTSGSAFKSPAVNYYQVEQDLLKTAENTAQVFFGIRTQCAQCHNHPFDRWTMDDYYSFAAFFAQVGRKPTEDYRDIVIYNRAGGETSNPVTKKQMTPKFLGGVVPEIKPGEDRRVVLANWLTSTDNKFFAPNVANRIWDHFFGLGIVDPVDDIRVSNPATNPELLQALGDKLVEYKYDFKRLVRDICLSNTYQRSGTVNESNAGDGKNFSHSTVRRVRAESLLDIITQATETKEKFQRLPLGARAVQIADGSTSNYFLDTFGRSNRLTVCADDVKTDPSLSQSLHLLNGPTIESKISNGGSIDRWLKAGKTPSEIIDTIFIRCLTRKPTAEEKAKLLAIMPEKNPQKELTDVYWAVLNSREFVFNH